MPAHTEVRLTESKFNGHCKLGDSFMASMGNGPNHMQHAAWMEQPPQTNVMVDGHSIVLLPSSITLLCQRSASGERHYQSRLKFDTRT